MSKVSIPERQSDMKYAGFRSRCVFRRMLCSSALVTFYKRFTNVLQTFYRRTNVCKTFVKRLSNVCQMFVKRL